MSRVVKTIHHGNLRWRVIIPPRNGAPRHVRFFRSRDDAALFASSLAGARDDTMTGLMRLGQSDRARLLRCLELAGSVESIEKAVATRVARRPAVMKPLLDAVAECVEDKRRAGRSAPYVENLSIALGSFAKIYPDHNVSDVTREQIDSWLHGHGWSPGTIQTYLRRLETFFSWCAKRGYVASSPCSGIERPAQVDKAPGILTVDECARLLTVCRDIDPGLLPYFAISLFAGVRPEEIRRQTWDQVKGAHIEIQAARAKTRRRRLVEIQPTLAAWLALGGDLPVTNWRRRWREVRSKAGITWTPDCLRHSFCSYSLPLRGAAWTALQAGHSEQTLFAHYRELVTRAEAERFWRIRPSV